MATGALPKPDHEVRDFLLTTGALTVLCVAVMAAAHVSFEPGVVNSMLGNVAFYATGTTPAIGAFITRWRSTGSLRGLGLGFGRSGRYLGPSLAAGVLACIIIYTLARVTSGVPFTPRLPLLLSHTWLIIPLLLLVLVSEIGWRGLMSNRLAERTGVWAVAVWTSVAGTALTALEILVVPGYVDVPPAYGILLIGVVWALLGYPLTWLRERADSIWPPTLLVTTIGAGTNMVIDQLTPPGDPLLVGPNGVFMAVASAIIAISWWLYVRRTASAAA